MKINFFLHKDLISTSKNCELKKYIPQTKSYWNVLAKIKGSVKILHLGWWWLCIYTCNLYSSHVGQVLPLKYTVEVFNGLATFITIAQSVQQLILDNTHPLESVLTFRGQLKHVTPTNRSSKALPRCQHVRFPSLVPVFSTATAGIVSLSFIQCLQACIINVYRHRIVNSAIFARMYHRQLCDICGHVSSSTLQCLQACFFVNSTVFAITYHRQLYSICRRVSSPTLQYLQSCIIVNSTVFAGVSSPNLQHLQACIIDNSTVFAVMYNRQLYSICSHVSSLILRYLQARIIVNSAIFAGM
jgi:hypothetical protein